MDAYALGLLLGDGCLTGATTPTFATADPTGLRVEATRGNFELRGCDSPSGSVNVADEPFPTI